MATAQELVEALAERFPDDAADLHEALEMLRQQRLTSCERLARLSDSQWQRLGLPLGIEALLRDEVHSPATPAMAKSAATAAISQRAPVAREWTESRSAGTTVEAERVGHPQGQALLAPPDGSELPLESLEDDISLLRDPTRQRARDSNPVVSSGLHRRGAGHRQGRMETESDGRGGGLGSSELHPPRDLDALWRQLLEDTLPPEKRGALQASWDAVPDRYDRYMMFLEYSSYLRKPEVTEEDRKERRKQLEPLLQEFGMMTEEEEETGWQPLLLMAMLVGLLCFVGGVVYCSESDPEAGFELQSL